eukprot:145305_1
MSHEQRELTLFLLLLLWIGHSAANDIQFIDDVYSSHDIYLAWTVSSVIEPQIFQYRECGADEFISATINDAPQQYENKTSNVYSVTLNNLSPNTIYQIKISSQSDNIYRLQTLSKNDDWEFYLARVVPYAVGAVGAVILAPIALDMVGFGSIGITAGSAAAAIQSEIGLVEAGSTFAILQSAGMAGMSTETLLGVALRGAGVVSGIAGLVEDECHDTDHVHLIQHKLEDIKYFVIKNIDKIDIQSLKECIVSYVNDADVEADIDTFWDSVQSNYNIVYNDVPKQMRKIDWNKQKDKVTGIYEKVKHKIVDGIDYFLHKNKRN